MTKTHPSIVIYVDTLNGIQVAKRGKKVIPDTDIEKVSNELWEIEFKSPVPVRRTPRTLEDWS
jgi:hypothetical protein